jgi:hypothetical protein
MRFVRVLTLLVGLGLSASACGSTTSATSPSPVLVTDVLLGTVPVPVNGVLESSANNFVVGQGGGTVSVTLTSAVETLPAGTLLTTVTMGLALGTPSGTTCNTAALSGAYTIAQGGSAVDLSGTLAAGTYCVQVSDVTNQAGSVAFAVAVTHP